MTSPDSTSPKPPKSFFGTIVFGTVALFILLISGALAFDLIGDARGKAHAQDEAKRLNDIAATYTQAHNLPPFSLLPISTLADAGLVDWDTNKATKSFEFGYGVIPSGVAPNNKDFGPYAIVICGDEDERSAVTRINHLKMVCLEREVERLKSITSILTKPLR